MNLPDNVLIDREELHQLRAAHVEVQRLTHLLGSHADGHRCTCTMTDPGKSGIEPPEWEQDPWCPTHPDMAVVRADYDAARAEVAALRSRIEALASDCDEAADITSPLRADLLRSMAQQAREALASVEPSGEAESGKGEHRLIEPDMTDLRYRCTGCDWRASAVFSDPVALFHRFHALTPVPSGVSVCRCVSAPAQCPVHPVPSGGQADGEGEVVAALREVMALSSNDWGSAPDFAWLYGIVLGWDDEDGDALPELAAKFGWSPDECVRLQRLHAEFGSLAARPVLSREALRERMRGHWPATSRRGGIDCECGKGGSVRGYIDHLADVLAGEQRGPTPPPCADHREVQHRDGKQPWCKACGWNHGRPAVPARQVVTVLSEGQEAGR